MLKVVQTLTCDLCGHQILEDVQFPNFGAPIYHIGRKQGPAGHWSDLCTECNNDVLEALWKVKRERNAKDTDQ